MQRGGISQGVVGPGVIVGHCKGCEQVEVLS